MNTKQIVAIVVAIFVVAAGVGAAVYFINNNNKDTTEEFKVTFETDGYGSLDKNEITVKKGTTWNAENNVLKFSDGKKVTATATDYSAFSEWSSKEGKVEKATSITAKFAFTAKATSVYLTDNFENDKFTDLGQYPSAQFNVVPGIWVYGVGNTAQGVIKTACQFYGIKTIEFSTDGKKISKISDITDGNIYVRSWNGSKWVQIDDLTKVNLDDTKYLSIIHGKANDKGEAPTVNTTPDKIKWHYGEKIEHKITSGKMVKFYLSANFEYTFEPATGSSNPKTLLVKGIWISGYAPLGSTTDVAFMNALDEIGYEYNINDAFINSINNATGGNFLQSVWDKDNNQWMRDTSKSWFKENTVDVTDHMSITYGAWDGGFQTAPFPPDVLLGADDWYY